MLPTPTAALLQAAGGPAVPTWLRSWLWSAPVRLLVAVAIVALGAYLSKFVVRLFGRSVARQFGRQSVAQMVIHAIRAAVVVLFGGIAATVVGLDLGNVVLSVTVFSAVLGIVLAPIVGSVINGLFVLADQPYEIGDMIQLDDGTSGFVDDITLRYTKIFTLDNTFIVLPNSNIRERLVTNYSAEDERTRLSLTVVVTYESDVEQARSLMERAARGSDAVIEGGPDIRIGSARYPAKPTAYIDSYGDHGIHLTLRYWATRPYKLLTIRSEVQTRLRSLLADEDVDVEVAYPHQHLHFDETSGEARVAVREGTTPPTRERSSGAVSGGASRRDGGPSVDDGAASAGDDSTDGGPAPGS